MSHPVPGFAGQSQYGFAVVDLETTGLSPRQERVIEIAVVHTDHWGHPQAEWTTRINPQRPVTGTHIHGITDADVANAPTFDMVLPYLVGMLRGRALVAHNATFDSSFLAYEFGRARWAWPTVPTLDTMREAAHFLPSLSRRRLVDCCEACGVRNQHAHSALGDARATAAIVQRYFDPYWGIAPAERHKKLVVEGASIQWPSAPEMLTQHAPVLWEAGGVRPPTTRYRKPMVEKQLMKPLLDSVNVSELAPGARSGVGPYLEVVLACLEDGHITDDERSALVDIAAEYELDEAETRTAHELLVGALCAEAVRDGTVKKVEREEIAKVAGALGVDSAAIPKLLKEEKQFRIDSLGQTLKPLPERWFHGDPLRVDDAVALTGDCSGRRAEFEKAARAAGVRVGGITKKTVMLVTDDREETQKLVQAREAGIRIVDSATFAILLRYIQPTVMDGR